jgi:hypothetical protein
LLWRPDQITTPADAHPIKFQTLNLKLRCKDFKLMTRANIARTCQIPVMPRIFAVKCGVGFEALRAETGRA